VDFGDFLFFSKPQTQLQHANALAPYRWRRMTPVWFLFVYYDHNSSRLSSIPTAYYHDNDVTPEIQARWLPKITALPPVNELSRFLDTPLHERAKIPVTQRQFDSLISKRFDGTVEKKHLEKLFRVDSEEHAELLYRRFGSALDDGPPENGTENAFISFWDGNMRKIIETLIPEGVSIRDSCHHTSTGKLRPDLGILYKGICVCRGEEKSPSNPQDPRAELSDKMAWTYDPAPYVLGKVRCVTFPLP
jgi:hypothetical protein